MDGIEECAIKVDRGSFAKGKIYIQNDRINCLVTLAQLL